MFTCLFTCLFIIYTPRGGGGGGGGELARANRKIDNFQQKVMNKTEALMEAHKKQSESAGKIADLTAQLRKKEDEIAKKDIR